MSFCSHFRLQCLSIFKKLYQTIVLRDRQCSSELIDLIMCCNGPHEDGYIWSHVLVWSPYVITLGISYINTFVLLLLLGLSLKSNFHDSNECIWLTKFERNFEEQRKLRAYKGRIQFCLICVEKRFGAHRWKRAMVI